MTKNGPPSHPWSGGSSEEPYTEPADPWGDSAAAAPEPAWGAHPISMPPAMDSSMGYPAAPAYPAPWTPPAPPPRRRNTPILALVIVLGLLICGGLSTTAWLLSRDGTAAGRAAPSVSPTPPANGEVVNPQPRTSSDARFVAKGQCVRNEGTAASPDMKIVACARGTFEVLKRVDGQTTGEADAETKCAKVTNYTKWYFYDSELDSLDFVLCLRER